MLSILLNILKLKVVGGTKVHSIAVMLDFMDWEESHSETSDGGSLTATTPEDAKNAAFT